MNWATEEIQNLFNELVPSYGAADTKAGELVRGICRITHDFYNNGFGNNTSGGLMFIHEKMGNIDDEVHILVDYTRGEIYRGDYDGNCPIQNAIQSIQVKVAKYIEENPHLKEKENDDNIFIYSLEDFFDEDEFDEDWDDFDEDEDEDY